MSKMSDGAMMELMGHVRQDQQLKRQIDDLSGEREEVRKAIEMILRAHNLFDVSLNEIGLQVKMVPNRESRRMDYKTLMSEHEDLYGMLTRLEILKISKPKKMYRLTVSKLKKK